MIYGLRSEQTVTHTALWHSFKNCCSVWNVILLFQMCMSWHTKVMTSFIQACKSTQNAVNTLVTCSFKWLTYNVCVSSMKLTYSSKDSLFHSGSMYIGFKLITPTVQELCPSSWLAQTRAGEAWAK